MSIMVETPHKGEFNDLLDEGFLRIPLKNLLEYCDPLLDDAWGCGNISEDDVRLQVGFSEKYSRVTEDYEESATYEYNVGRIAYLLEHGWSEALEDEEPITVDIGLVSYTPLHLIVDGNHRVAAAKIRGDEEILVSIIGDVNKAVAVLCDGIHMDDYGFEAKTATYTVGV